ncbi:MAG: hypothetical protein LBD29_06495 [Treponema sp.]|nr:hypothetical protein [Treponema sp.]
MDNVALQRDKALQRRFMGSFSGFPALRHQNKAKKDFMKFKRLTVTKSGSDYADKRGY